MAELEKLDVYACALSMPNPEDPVCKDWVEEISRHVERNKDDEIYLVGHSLGVPAILRYLENIRSGIMISGAVLVSGPSEKHKIKKLDSFLDQEFDFEKIRSKCKAFSIIHGDNDPVVPLSNAKILSGKLKGELILVKNGGHLNGSAGWTSLPQCLEALRTMMK